MLSSFKLSQHYAMFEPSFLLNNNLSLDDKTTMAQLMAHQNMAHEPTSWLMAQLKQGLYYSPAEPSLSHHLNHGYFGVCEP